MGIFCKDGRESRDYLQGFGEKIGIFFFCKYSMEKIGICQKGGKKSRIWEKAGWYLDQGDRGAVEEAEDEEDDEGRGRRPEVVEVVLLRFREAVEEGFFWGGDTQEEGVSIVTQPRGAPLGAAPGGVKGGEGGHPVFGLIWGDFGYAQSREEFLGCGGNRGRGEHCIRGPGAV